MAVGTIVKTSSTIYEVKNKDGRVACRPCGRFRVERIHPLAGDRVEFDPKEAVITEILPRKNRLVRPPVANVDRLVIVASLAPPRTADILLDSLTAFAFYKGLEPLLVINKTDACNGSELAKAYCEAGIPSITVSARTGEGIEQLKCILSSREGGLSVLSGSSGVGKSSLINALGLANAVTGELSERIGRGKQTTRHIELMKLGGGYIADTPGYSSFDPIEMEMTDVGRLSDCFPEFSELIGSCRYGDCTHVSDEGCAVVDAVRSGRIAQSRHHCYCELYKKLKPIKEWMLK